MPGTDTQFNSVQNSPARWVNVVGRSLSQFIFLLISLTTTSAAMPAHNDVTQLHISGAVLPNVFEPGGDGPYNVIYRRVAKDMQSKPHLTLMPTKRAQRIFYTQETDCLFVATGLEWIYQDRGFDMSDIVLSKPVYNHPMRVYSGRDMPLVNSPAHMSGQRIAVDAAAISSEGAKSLMVPDDAIIVPASTTEQAFSLLVSGRVDYVVAFAFDVEALAQRLPRVRDFPFAPDFALIRNPEVFACHRTPATEAFIAHVDDVLEEMRADQTLTTLFSTDVDTAR